MKLKRVTISMCYKGKYIPPKKGRTSRRYNGNIQQKKWRSRRDWKGARKGLKDTSKTFKLSFLDIMWLCSQIHYRIPYSCFIAFLLDTLIISEITHNFLLTPRFKCWRELSPFVDPNPVSPKITAFTYMLTNPVFYKYPSLMRRGIFAQPFNYICISWYKRKIT